LRAFQEKTNYLRRIMNITIRQLLKKYGIKKLVKRVFAVISVILVLIDLTPVASGQQFHDLIFEKVIFDNGKFPQNISKICQDDLGFIWIASDNGLSRYDGYGFYDFRSSLSDTTSISSNIVSSLFYDSYGQLWVGTSRGLNRFNPLTEQFVRYTHKSDDKSSIADNLISPVYEDRFHNLWIGTYGGLSRYNRAFNNFTSYSHVSTDSTSLSSNVVSCIFEDREGRLWVGTWGGGLNLFNKSKGTFTHFVHHPSDSNSLSHNYVSFIVEDTTGTLWIGTRGGGLNEFDPESKTFKHYRGHRDDKAWLNDDVLTSAWYDENGLLWIGTWSGGLNIFDPGKKQFVSYRYNPEDSQSLVSDCITFIFKDRTGILFIGTNKGMNKVKRKLNSFSFFTQDTDKDNRSLNSKDVRAVYEDENGGLWLGTHEGGLNRMDLRSGRFTYYTFGQEKAPGPVNIDVSGIVDNHDGTFWVSSIGHGLYTLSIDGQYKYFENFSKSDLTVYSDYITYLFKDHRGRLWLGFPNGVLNIANPVTGEVTSFKIDERIESKALLNEINHIVEDDKGDIWVAVRHMGLYRIVDSTLSIVHYPAMSGKDFSISDDDVMVLHLSKNNVMWVGTMNGLNKCDLQTGSARHFFTLDGLPDNAVRSITEDKTGNLWIGTHKGLARFDTLTERFINYDERDGLPIKQFNSTAYFSKKDNEMIMGGYNGFIRFSPDNITGDIHKPKVHITGLDIYQKKAGINQKVMGRVVLHKSILFSDTIELSHLQNDFSLSFASLHYKMPDKNQYAYMLENYDLSLIYCGNKRSAKYMNLPPGKYRFKVIGSNSDGVWNETGDSMMIIIDPPWWKTWWMIGCYILFLVAAFIVYVKLKNAKHLKDKRVLENLIEQRTHKIAHQNVLLAKQADEIKENNQMLSRFYTYVSHEFRTPLSMIIGPLYQLISGTNTEDANILYKTMFRNAQRLLTLVAELLDLSRLEKGRMELSREQLNVNKLTNEITSSFAEEAGRRHISLSFLQNGPQVTTLTDKDKLEKILINLISNALKYTSAGGDVKVALNTTLKSKYSNIIDNRKYPGGWFEISVKDNGIGIDRQYKEKIFDHFFRDDTSRHEGWGIGLAFVKELIVLFEGDIFVESEPGKGSEFTVFLPVTKTDAPDENPGEENSGPGKTMTVVEGSCLPADCVKQEGGEAVLRNQTALKFSDGSRPDVLVVEDDEDLRHFIVSLLEEKCKVEIAENGRRALEHLKKEETDIVISDIMMPEMDGLELCRSIKSDINICHIPVILLTAKSADSDKIEGLEQKADDYITKPFNPEELVQRVANLIELRKLLQNKYRQQAFLEPEQSDVPSLDDQFLCRVRAIIEREIGSSALTVEMIYTEMAIGRSNFHRKFKALTGQSANQFIRSYRLKKARQLLEQKAGNISQVAYEVGFTSTAYFTKCFKDEFGMLPSKVK
jgi:signal transduction histidine kinase/ligand-binding sensor domain-containing protein/CheY-like chemotaxis protein